MDIVIFHYKDGDSSKHLYLFRRFIRIGLYNPGISIIGIEYQRKGSQKLLDAALVKLSGDKYYHGQCGATDLSCFNPAESSFLSLSLDRLYVTLSGACHALDFRYNRYSLTTV